VALPRADQRPVRGSWAGSGRWIGRIAARTPPRLLPWRESGSRGIFIFMIGPRAALAPLKVLAPGRWLLHGHRRRSIGEIAAPGATGAPSRNEVVTLGLLTLRDRRESDSRVARLTIIVRIAALRPFDRRSAASWPRKRHRRSEAQHRRGSSAATMAFNAEAITRCGSHDASWARLDPPRRAGGADAPGAAGATHALPAHGRDAESQPAPAGTGGRTRWTRSGCLRP
jgi:hypothetical protein